MRLPALLRVFAVSLAGLFATPPMPAFADDPPSVNSDVDAAATGVEKVRATDDPQDTLNRGLDFERQKRWTAAIEVYETALEHWPSRVDFRQRLRLCETHYRLGRRYQDPSFRNVLLRLPRDRAIELYDELIERIESHYVEPVEMEPLVRRGLDNLEVALRDAAFVQTNLNGTDPARVKQTRQSLVESRPRISVSGRAQTVAYVAAVCDQLRSTLGVNPAPVVLEFAFGACDALDDYSGYLTPNKLDDLFSMIDGNFVGLGVELKHDELGLRLVGVIRGGPASDAGIKPGDRITHIAGESIAGQGLDEAAGKLQGGEGSTVDLVILHPDGKSQKLRLTRRSVEVRSVAQARIVEPITGIGYIQLIGFQKSSTDELRDAIDALQRKGLRYLVLDLRGNPGGLLNVAVDIADLFLDQGVIVSTRGRAANQSMVYRAHTGSLWRMPMAVLVDHDSASASEILAGALKDHNRALVLGERSYGKGSVQSIFPLKAASAGLKLTTAKFYSPLNRPYSEHGVEPDIAVRTAARPNNATNTLQPPPEFGDPARDPVLEQAIRAARRTYSRAG